MNIERAIGAERTGYGKLGFELEKSLARRGLVDPESSLRIIVAPPYALKYKYAREEVWAFCMYEASRIPESFLEVIDSYDGLICPIELNQTQFQAEVSVPVHLAPLGVDPEVFYFRPRTVQDTFNVAFFGRSPRKGADVAPAIFDAAFPDAAELDPKPVYLHNKVGGAYDEQGMADLMGQTHVVLAPSRGEGWNLMPFEALATGCPIVLTDIPGHVGFSDLPGAFKTPTSLVDSDLGGSGAWWAGYWWEPDIEAAATELRMVYENYQMALSAAKQGSEHIRGHMSWDHTAQAVLDAVGPRKRPSLGPREIVPLKLRVWEVEVTKPISCDIGPNHIQAETGDLITLTGDQLRVLTDAGVVNYRGNWMTSWADINPVHKEPAHV